MRYSIEPRERRNVKGYGFLSFARNTGTHGTKVAKNMSNKYSQKLADTALGMVFHSTVQVNLPTLVGVLVGMWLLLG